MVDADTSEIISAGQGSLSFDPPDELQSNAAEPVQLTHDPATGCERIIIGPYRFLTAEDDATRGDEVLGVHTLSGRYQLGRLHCNVGDICSDDEIISDIWYLIWVPLTANISPDRDHVAWNESTADNAKYWVPRELPNGQPVQVYDNPGCPTGGLWHPVPGTMVGHRCKQFVQGSKVRCYVAKMRNPVVDTVRTIPAGYREMLPMEILHRQCLFHSQQSDGWKPIDQLVTGEHADLLDKDGLGAPYPGRQNGYTICCTPIVGQELISRFLAKRPEKQDPEMDHQDGTLEHPFEDVQTAYDAIVETYQQKNCTVLLFNLDERVLAGVLQLDADGKPVAIRQLAMEDAQPAAVDPADIQIPDEHTAWYTVLRFLKSVPPGYVVIPDTEMANTAHQCFEDYVKMCPLTKLPYESYRWASYHEQGANQFPVTAIQSQLFASLCKVHAALKSVHIRK